MPPPTWTMRLPRSIAFGHEVQRSARFVNQRRWLQARPPPPPKPRPSPRSRVWANTGKSNAEDTQSALQRTQKSYGAEQAQQQQATPQPQPEPQVSRTAALASALAQSEDNDLVTEVHIPKDADGVLQPGHPATSILGNSSLVITRQMEFMNLIIGMEQANRYTIMDGEGNTHGSIAEMDNGIGKSMMRQFAKTHRSFSAHIFDAQGREVLRIHRPFAWINSKVRIHDAVPEGGYEGYAAAQGVQNDTTTAVATQGPITPQLSPLNLEEMRIIGEVQQEWAPLRRKYHLFAHRPSVDETSQASNAASASRIAALTNSNPQPEAGNLAQFAAIDAQMLSWDFNLTSTDAKTIGAVNRNFRGFGREIFTDTGAYALRMDSASQTSALETSAGQEVARYEKEATSLTLDQRAVMLATAVSIDFDYFSRHSSHASGVGFMPIWWPFGGGGAAAEGVGAAGAGAAGGAVEGVAGGAVGAAGRGLGSGAGAAGEGAIAGAGTMAGYEAMQRGAYGPRGGDDASPTANEPYSDASPGQTPPSNDTWGEGQDPWGGSGGGGGAPPPAGGGGEGGEGGGWGDVFSDFFSD
ncbi:hypothetical protein B0A48_00885 [Cryoendolithus antarcticus]|uniref:Scramblase-domain-containing protein n=1 Tax=Cryoendolithus antarcticus TaxID=1507870 RepID=A0A1V8TRM3_9PEZI|nr:hypothetical protein B0A48_00885 [Cryoendolithus antarcticus]